MPKDIYAEQIEKVDYSPHLLKLRTEKDQKKLSIEIMILKAKLLWERFERKNSGDLSKNPQEKEIIVVIRELSKSENTEVRQNALDLLREIDDAPSPESLQECRRLVSVTLSEISARRNVEFYIDHCTKNTESENLRFLEKALASKNVEKYQKESLALNIGGENDLVVDVLIESAKQYADTDDWSNSRRIEMVLCYKRGVKNARKIKPLLDSAYYQNFAQHCLSEMSDEIADEITPLLESKNYSQRRQGIRILSELRPKSAIPTIQRKLASLP